MPVIVQCMTSHNDQSKVCGVLEFVSELVNLATTSQSKFVRVLLIYFCMDDRQVLLYWNTHIRC